MLKNLLPAASKSLRNYRQYSQIIAQLPASISKQFKTGVKDYGDKNNVPIKDASLSTRNMDTLMPFAAKLLQKLLKSNESDPQVAKFTNAIDEYSKQDGKAKVLVVENMSISGSDQKLFTQLGILGVAQILGAKKLWKMQPDSITAKAGFISSPVFDVIAKHDGRRDAAQVPHVDQYSSINNIPPLAALYCESNEQKTPTYFIAADAIWDKLDGNDKKNLTGDNFMLADGIHHSEPFPIFKVEGDHCKPKSVEVCFDLDSSDFRCKPEAHKSFEKLHDIIAQLASPYHEQTNVPENNDKTSQHVSKNGDAVFWTNKLGMHGRPEVQYTPGATTRNLSRFYFDKDAGDAPAKTR